MPEALRASGIAADSSAMREQLQKERTDAYVLSDLLTWWRSGETVGTGTVVGTWRSAPRQPGRPCRGRWSPVRLGGGIGLRRLRGSAVYALAQAGDQ